LRARRNAGRKHDLNSLFGIVVDLQCFVETCEGKGGNYDFTFKMGIDAELYILGEEAAFISYEVNVTFQCFEL